MYYTFSYSLYLYICIFVIYDSCMSQALPNVDITWGYVQFLDAKQPLVSQIFEYCENYIAEAYCKGTQLSCYCQVIQADVCIIGISYYREICSYFQAEFGQKSFSVIDLCIWAQWVSFSEYYPTCLVCNPACTYSLYSVFIKQ